MFPKGWRFRFLGIMLVGGIGFLFLVVPSQKKSPLLGADPKNPLSAGHSSSFDDTNSPSEEEGDKLLAQAIIRLESQPSVSGKIHYYFELFDDLSVEGVGTYLAQWTETGPMFRWELLLPRGEEKFLWWELFDGKTLWTYSLRPKEEKENLQRVDVLQVAQYLKKQGNLPKIGEIGNWPGLGGLPRLLRSLHSHFQFTLLESSSVGFTDGQTSQQMPVWKLLGLWKPDRLAALLPDQAERIQQGLPVLWENVPRWIPDHVIVLLGQEDLFPYAICYQRKPSGRWTGWLSQFAWGSPPTRTLARLEVVELNLHVPLPPESFRYQPPDRLSPSDATQEFIQQLQKRGTPIDLGRSK